MTRSQYNGDNDTLFGVQVTAPRQIIFVEDILLISEHKVINCSTYITHFYETVSSVQHCPYIFSSCFCMKFFTYSCPHLKCYDVSKTFDSSETVFSSNMSGLLDIVELDAEEDGDEIDEDEELAFEDEDGEAGNEDGRMELSDRTEGNHLNTDSEHLSMNSENILVPKDGLQTTPPVDEVTAKGVYEKSESPPTTGLSSVHDYSKLNGYRRHNCVCREAINEQYDRHEYQKLMAHYHVRDMPRSEQSFHNHTFWSGLALEHIQFNVSHKAFL